MKKTICCFIFIFIFTESFCAEDIVRRLNNLNKYLDQKKMTVTGFLYNERGKRDPFIPLVGLEQFLKSVEALTDQERESLPGLPSLTEMKNLFPFTLIGIVHSEGGKSLAIINDKILEKGDEVDGAKVLEIEQGSVRLLWKKKTISLSLKEEKILK